jgi:hypothetical protein
MSGKGHLPETRFAWAGLKKRLRMNGDKTISPLALRRIGEVLRGQYGIEARLPFRLYCLVEQLTRITEEENCLENAAEIMRPAQHAPSSSDKPPPLKLADWWVELAERAHEDTQRPRRSTTLHPVVRKRMDPD